MRRPQDADRVVELTYGVSMVVYMVIAVCGYLMYGRNVSDEVSCLDHLQDVTGRPGYRIERWRNLYT
jgi:vesicular inhibitory amino acid transporter